MARKRLVEELNKFFQDKQGTITINNYVNRNSQ